MSRITFGMLLLIGVLFAGAMLILLAAPGSGGCGLWGLEPSARTALAQTATRRS